MGKGTSTFRASLCAHHRTCTQWFNHRPSQSLVGEPGTVQQVGLLCIGLFQEGAPELVALGGLGKDQLVVVCGQAVIDDDIHPVSVAPELNKGKQNKTLG